MTNNYQEWAVWASYKNSLGRFQASLPNNKYIFLVTGSFGDLIPNYFLVEDFARIVNEKVRILTYDYCKAFTERLDKRFIEVTFISAITATQLHGLLIQSGYPFLRERGLIFPLLPTLHPQLAEAVITDRISEYEVRRLLLDLKKGHPVNFRYDQRSSEIVGRTLEVLNARGKIIISPLSNTNQSISSDFIDTLTEHLLNDYEIIINLFGADTSTRANYNDLKKKRGEINFLDFSPEQIFEAIRHTGRHIGPYNGLTLLLGRFDQHSRNVIFREKILKTKTGVSSPDPGSVKKFFADDWTGKVNILELVLAENALNKKAEIDAISEVKNYFKLTQALPYVNKDLS